MNVHSLPLPFIEPTARSKRASWPRPADPTAVPRAVPKPSRHRAIWLAVHLGNWPMHAALSTLSELERSTLVARSLAVVDSDRRGTVVACNEVAQRQGIRAGHSLNSTIALCAETKFLTRMPQREHDLLREVADLASSFTSGVQLQPPNELLLEVRGSFRLFGGMAALLERVRTDFELRGFKPQMALSATSQSALWIARSAAMSIVPPRALIQTIARLPVSLLHWPADLELRLTRFGVLCIGDLLKLPRGSLARRIGHDRLAELDHAVGRHPQVRKAYRPTEQFSDRILLDFEIETTGLLGRVIEKHLARLNEFLTSRNLAVDEVLVDLSHREHPATPVRIGLAAPTADVAHIAGLLHEQLTRTTLCAPVTEIRLRVTHLKSAPSISRELFRGSHGDAAAASTQHQARLLEQLRSRLGVQAIAALRAVADYRPERAQSLAPAQIGEVSYMPNHSTTMPQRPLWLLPEPRSLRLKRRAELPRLQGPELIEAGWWDMCGVARRYFHVRTPLGARAWMYEDLKHPGHFLLHGLFG